jgi:hypothetical protein
MSDNPMDRISAVDRVSIRAVLVHEGEDPSAALAEAGFANAIAVPVLLGEEADLSGGILGNGITPNLTAVLETEEQEDMVATTQSGSVGAASDAAEPQAAVTTTLPAAFGMQPLAPVLKIGG